MSSYLIFVLVLTAVCIIYYAVIITKDLYGKKDEAKSTEEVFDLSGIANAEESIAVEENEGGFSVGTDSYDTIADAVGVEANNGIPTANKAYMDNGSNGETKSFGDEEIVNQSCGEDKNAFEQMKAKMEEQMEETESFMSDPMTDEELYAAMIMKEPKLKWNLVKNEI